MTKQELSEALYLFRDLWCQNVDIATVDEFVEQYRADQPDRPTDKWQQIADEIREWSDATFGVSNPVSMVHHLKKEVDELIEDLNKVQALGKNIADVGEFETQVRKTYVEFADCQMLLLDAISHFGLSTDNLLTVVREKLEINKARKWGKPNEQGFTEHIEPDKPTDDWSVLKSVIEGWKFLTPDKDGWSFPYHILNRIKDCTDYDDGEFVSEEQIEDVLMAIIQIATYQKKPLPTPPQQKP